MRETAFWPDTQGYEPARPKTLWGEMMLYVLVVAALRLLVPLIFQIHIEGKVHIPKEGAVVLEPTTRACGTPIFVVMASRRPVHFMAKEEFFRIPILGRILPHLKAFPVRRGDNDRTCDSAGAVGPAGGGLYWGFLLKAPAIRMKRRQALTL